MRPAASVETGESRLFGGLAEAAAEVGFVGAGEGGHHQRIDGAADQEIEIGREGGGDLDASGAEYGGHPFQYGPEQPSATPLDSARRAQSNG